MRSFMSVFAQCALKASGYKSKVNNPVRMERYTEKCRKINLKPYKISALARMKAPVERENVNGTTVYVVNKTPEAKRYILYLHGGAYMEMPVPPHWWFIDKLALETGRCVIVPIHPKAPDHTYSETYELLLQMYKQLLTEVPAQSVIFMGDSSGGGLALGFAQYLRQLGLPQPDKLILFSPWLDITMENADITPELNRRDPSLGVQGLIQMGKAWAGDTDAHDYRLSPIYGSLESLAEITLFVGTYEIFISDARKFRQLAQDSGVSISYYEYPKMNHCFVLYPTPEAKRAQKQVFNIINARQAVMK